MLVYAALSLDCSSFILNHAAIKEEENDESLFNEL